MVLDSVTIHLMVDQDLLHLDMVLQLLPNPLLLHILVHLHHPLHLDMVLQLLQSAELNMKTSAPLSMKMSVRQSKTRSVM